MSARSRNTQDELLDLFRGHEGELISGSELSRLLGISRTAVWKQIHALGEQGYPIEAVPSRGYRLVETPDLMCPAEIRSALATECVGGQLRFFDSIDSTNSKARELGDQGAVEGTVVIADAQSGGKGRMGRRWSSPAGVNLYASVLLRPAILPWDAPHLTFVSAVAVARAIEEVSGLRARVKWPNDILVGKKKIAGLLNEMSAEMDKLNYVVLGMGVNLNMRCDQFPDDLRYPATSIFLETGKAVSRLSFTRCLLRHLDELYRLYLDQGFPAVARHWATLCDLVGTRVHVDQQQTQVEGVVLGLDDDGALLLELDDGSTQRVLSGDVRPCG